MHPSGGRFGQSGVGDFVSEYGFGHEDWNFNFNLTNADQILGYTAALPAERYKGDTFGLVMAIYEAGEWRAAGYYSQAVFLPEARPPSPEAVEQMALDVFELAAAGQINNRYNSMTLKRIRRSIAQEFVYFRWSAPKSHAILFAEPLKIPKRVFNPGVQRMRISYDLTQAQFEAVTRLGEGISNMEIDRNVDLEGSEGQRSLRLHWHIERDRKLISAFRAKLSSFECSVCAFDFQETYGSLGADFIECHHTKPVAEMQPGETTKLTDLRAVCANCHRMLHRGGELLRVEDLKALVEGAAAK